MSTGTGAYSTTATVYGMNARDSYYNLSAPGLINSNLEITGNLKVDGTTELVGALTCDALATASAGLTVGGAAVSPAVPGLSVQSSAGRIAIAAGSNFLQINGFDANGAAAGIVMGAGGGSLTTNALAAASAAVTGAVTAASVSASGAITSTGGVLSSSFATSGKLGTTASPILTAGQLGYSGCLRLLTAGGVGNLPYTGVFDMPAGCSTASQVYLSIVNIFGDNAPTAFYPAQTSIAAGGATGFQATVVVGQVGATNSAMQINYLVIV